MPLSTLPFRRKITGDSLKGQKLTLNAVRQRQPSAANAIGCRWYAGMRRQRKGGGRKVFSQFTAVVAACADFFYWQSFARTSSENVTLELSRIAKHFNKKYNLPQYIIYSHRDAGLLEIETALRSARTQWPQKKIVVTVDDCDAFALRGQMKPPSRDSPEIKLFEDLFRLFAGDDISAVFVTGTLPLLPERHPRNTFIDISHEPAVATAAGIPEAIVRQELHLLAQHKAPALESEFVAAAEAFLKAFFDGYRFCSKMEDQPATLSVYNTQQCRQFFDSLLQCPHNGDEIVRVLREAGDQLALVAKKTLKDGLAMGNAFDHHAQVCY